MCVFCDIVHNDIPTNKIYEDDNVIAILDANPVSLGHTLIITKRHYENILVTDEKTNKSITKAIQLIGNSILRTYGKGINVVSNINECAGQSVMHAHIHLIPVDENDNKLKVEYNSIGKIDSNKITEDIKNNIKQK